MGKLVSSTPSASMRSWNHLRMTFQMYMLAGRMIKKPEILQNKSISDARQARSMLRGDEGANLLVVLDHLGLEHDLLVPGGEVLLLLGRDADNVVGFLALADGEGLLGSLLSLRSRLCKVSVCTTLGDRDNTRARRCSPFSRSSRPSSKRSLTVLQAGPPS